MTVSTFGETRMEGVGTLKNEANFRRMTQKLVDFTNRDVVRWYWHGDNKSSVVYDNGKVGFKKKFFVDLPKNGLPTFRINDSEISIRGYGIEELLAAIDNQYQRFEINKYDKKLSREELDLISKLGERNRGNKKRITSVGLDTAVIIFLADEGEIE